MVLVLFLALFSGASAHAQSAKPLKCEMKWDLISEGVDQQSFVLATQADLKVYKNTRVHVERHGEQSKVEIVQDFGAKSKNHITYQLACSNSSRCAGFRSETVLNQKTDRRDFQIDVTTELIAKIGARDIFHYQVDESGFSYRFIQYTLRDGTAKGMELRCHD